MDIPNRLLPLKSVTELPSLLTFKREDEESEDEYEILGSIMGGSKYCWIASQGNIQILCMQSGHKIAARKFGTLFKNQDTYIMCGCEVPIPTSIGTSIIALGLQHGTNDGTICLFTSQGCRVLCTVNIGEPVSCICLIDPGGNLTGPLSAFDGILAIGTTNGNVLLLDIWRQACIDTMILGPEYTFDENRPHQCLKVLPKMGENYEALREMAQAKGEHLAFSLDAMSFLGQVSCLLMIPPLSALVIGSTTGAVAIVDLSQFKLIYKTQPVHGPVQHMAFQEPSDDPRAHCFLWVIHSGTIGTVANLHQLVYRKKQAHSFKYQEFVSAHSPFTLALSNEESQAISCQSVHKKIVDESTLSLCIFSWISKTESYLCIFDINQWYKRGMPAHAFIDSEDGFFIVYPIEIDVSPVNYIDLKLDVASIVPFKSHQRFDEYYRPGSLSFDCNVLTPTKNVCLHWPGLQVNALRKLSNGGSAGLIAPTSLYLECLSVYLLPMFHETHYTYETPVAEQRDMLLSLALDYGHIGYLQCCATSWADGSHAGPADSGSEGGPTLRTMIDWVWRQTIRVKNHTNALSVQLFDNSGISLDATSKRNFTHCISQFKILFTLVRTIIESCKEYISSPVKEELESLKKSLETFTEYSEVVQFLLNIGLLPEVLDDHGHDTDIGPFSSKVLKQFYDQRREEISSVKNFSVNWGCEILFIDALIEFECGGENLRRIWLLDGGSPRYPPDSLQALLYVYLQKDVSTINKHILFIYLFLDVASTLDDERSAIALNYLLKFASVFGVHASVITNTKAFWHLDQKQFKTALDLLIDPLSQTRSLTQWQHSLLLSSLVNQGAFREALQVMRAPGPHLDPQLQLKILLENNLMCEAFQCQRMWGGKELLKTFFKGCIRYGNISSVMGLSLTEQEEEELDKFLQKSDTVKADNLRVLYYLQRSRFVEAISVNNNLHHHQHSSQQHGSPTNKMSTRDMIVNAFQNTLPEVTKKLADYSRRDKLIFDKILNVENPTPLSVSIVTNVTKDPITKSSMLLEKYSQMSQLQRGVKRILDIEDTPFLRTPISTLNDHDKSSPLIYPKSTTTNHVEEENHCNGNGDISTPIKRQKLETPVKMKSGRGKNKSKSLLYNLHKQRGNPYNFDGIANHVSGPVEDRPNEDSFTISTLSSPSQNMNLSLLDTPLVKRKNSTLINQNDSVYNSIRTRQSILKVPGKDSAKKLGVDSPNVSEHEASIRSIHFADDASTASEISEFDMDIERFSRETSVESSKPAALGATTRRSLRTSNTSKATSKSTNSASTGDEVYYSISSGSNERHEAESKINHAKDNTSSENSSHSENSNDAKFSDNPESAASSEKDFDSDRQERSISGPRPRRSLRLSKVNESLHKVKQTSSMSSISKAKAKANESLTQKLLDLASEQNRYLNKLVLESNAYKVEASNFSRKSKVPRVRDPIHPATSKSDTENDANVVYNENISKEIESQNEIEVHESISHSLKIVSVEENCNISQPQGETSKSYKISSRKSNVSLRVQLEDKGKCKIENSENLERKGGSNLKRRVSFFSHDDHESGNSSKVEIQKSTIQYSNAHDSNVVQNDEECIKADKEIANEENKSVDLDIYENIMTDIIETISQKSEHDGKGYDHIDVEPMQTCPDLILDDERSEDRQDEELIKNTPVLDNICILSATTITVEEFNDIATDHTEAVIENRSLEEELTNESKPEEMDIAPKKQDIVSVHCEIDEVNSETENEPKKSEATDVQTETILIDSSDESSVGSADEHNVGAIELKDTTPDTVSSATVGEEENSEDANSSTNDSGSDSVEKHERNILGDTDFERSFTIDEDDCEIIEDDDEEGLGEDQDDEDEEEDQDGDEGEDVDEEEEEEVVVEEAEEEEQENQDEEEQENQEEEQEDQEEDDDVLLIDEYEEIDEKEKNILDPSGFSTEILVETQERYEENSRSSNSQGGQNENNNVTEVVDEEEHFETDSNVINQGMIVSQIEQTTIEVGMQSASYVNQTDMMNEGQVEFMEVDQTIEIETEDQQNEADVQENMAIEKDNLDDQSHNSDTNSEKLQLSTEDLSVKPDDAVEINEIVETNEVVDTNEIVEINEVVETNEITVNAAVDKENSSEVISTVEQNESDKFFPALDEMSNENSKVSNEPEKKNDSGNKNSTVESESSYADALHETDELDKTYHTEVSIAESDIIDKFEFIGAAVSDPNRKFSPVNMTMGANKTQTDDLDKTHKTEFSIISEPDCLDRSEFSIVEEKIVNEDIVSNSDKVEMSTPKTTERRRSRRLSALSRIDEDSDVEEELNDELDSITSEASGRSTRSRTKMLSTPAGTPLAENTPRRSSRRRSTNTSPASDIETNFKTTRKYTRRSSSVDASPVSAPTVTKTPTQKGKRRSLLAVLSEPVIPEENPKEDNEENPSQKVKEYHNLRSRRSTDSSHASDIEINYKTTRKYTRRSSVESSPASSPTVAETHAHKAKRKSLLTTVTEADIPEDEEEKSEPDHEDLSQQVEEYSKERRLTRQQRTMLMRSMASSKDQSSSSKQSPKKRRLSRPTETSESDVPVQSGLPSTPEGSISSVQTSESTQVKRSSFLKAQEALKCSEKKTKSNSIHEEDGYESEASIASVKSALSKANYKFSAPMKLDQLPSTNGPAKNEVTVPRQEFFFSPPKYSHKGLPTIDEERSLSAVASLEKIPMEQDNEQPVTKLTKGGRPRRNSTSSNNSQTTPKTRSSSRNSKK